MSPFFAGVVMIIGAVAFSAQYFLSSAEIRSAPHLCPSVRLTSAALAIMMYTRGIHLIVGQGVVDAFGALTITAVSLYGIEQVAQMIKHWGRPAGGPV